jgi:hypothetical protein
MLCHLKARQPFASRAVRMPGIVEVAVWCDQRGFPSIISARVPINRPTMTNPGALKISGYRTNYRYA